jgi:hypothetical protein
MTQANSIAFLALARVEDQAILAQRFDKGTIEVERTTIENSVKTLAQRAARLNYPGWKDQSQCPAAFDGSVYAMADHQCSFVVAAAVRGGLYPYPARIVWEMLGKLMEDVQSSDLNLTEAKPATLSMSMKKTMQDLMKGYSNPGERDSVTQVQEKVDAVKGMMHENVRKILETHTTLEALQEKSDEMNSSADQFVKQSANLKRQMQVRNIKVKAILAVSVTALGVYVLLPFFSAM